MKPYAPQHEKKKHLWAIAQIIKIKCKNVKTPKKKTPRKV